MPATFSRSFPRFCPAIAVPSCLPAPQAKHPDLLSSMDLKTVGGPAESASDSPMQSATPQSIAPAYLPAHPPEAWLPCFHSDSAGKVHDQTKEPGGSFFDVNFAELPCWPRVCPCSESGSPLQASPRLCAPSPSECRKPGAIHPAVVPPDSKHPAQFYSPPDAFQILVRPIIVFDTCSRCPHIRWESL